MLDVGCGSGYLDILLAQKTGFHIIGVDISKNALQLGKKMVEDAGFEHRISFVRGDVFNLSFRDNSFEIAISTGYESAGAYLGATKEVSRVVKEGGR
jgi:cyclopropane-fatty-acyl-phospholipid synthase